MKITTPKPVVPGPGQESVWDYPRPPKLERTSKRIQIIFNDEMVADTGQAYRVLETSHPPVYYLPPNDVEMALLSPVGRGSWCEWKGQAVYYDLQVGERKAPRSAWAYPRPSAAFRQLKDHLAFYAWAMDRCLVDGEVVRPQPGNFYGGWITHDITGPFKGVSGSSGW